MKRPYIRSLISCSALPVYLLLSAAVFASGSLVLPPELANATIKGTEYGPVTLHDGSWEGEPWVEGGASRPRVGLASDFILHGDIDGDGIDEAVVLVWQSSGGSGTFNYIALMDKGENGPHNTATTPLGDRVKVLGGSISENLLELQVIEHDEDDPACCPTREATRFYDSELRAIDPANRKPQ